MTPYTQIDVMGSNHLRFPSCDLYLLEVSTCALLGIFVKWGCVGGVSGVEGWFCMENFCQTRVCFGLPLRGGNLASIQGSDGQLNE